VSKTAPTRSITPTAIRARKGGQPLASLTSYTAPMTRLVDPHVPT
jgi:3-methyl-2-oxobutanoate hydroxymethyltransferase